jgi:uracil phosphoribosyltransferase
MTIETNGEARVITHALSDHVLSELRARGTEQIAFRKGLVKLGRLCGYELIDDRFEVRETEIETPLTRTTGPRVEGLDDVVVVNVLRAATPFVEGLMKAFPGARQGVISAGRDESAGMNDDGSFPITVDYVKLPEITDSDTVIVADPMLATGSTMCTVLDRIGRNADPETVVLTAVSAPEGVERVVGAHPGADLVTVAVDERLDDDGYIVPGLGDAGDRAFGTGQ